MQPSTAIPTIDSSTPLWEKPWYYSDPRERAVLPYLITIHVLAIGGALLFPLPSWHVIAASLTLAFLGGLGTTVTYHRALTHKGVQLAGWVEQVMIFFVMFGGVGAPRPWVATHKFHHATSDTPRDVSSPHHGGFWWAHLRWLWQTSTPPFERYCPELNRPAYRFWEKLQIPILICSAFFGLIWGPSAWIWLGPMRLIFVLHGQCTVNSICHLGEVEKSARGSSINVWWLTPLHLGVGENWHANHHSQQMNPRLGTRLHQIDVGWWTIRLLQSLGLAKNLRQG